jgi:predicted nucleic acid-binding protein
MKEPFVADSSIGVAWIHPSQASDWTRRLLQNVREGATVHVTSIWHLEIANALLVAVRRKLLTDAHRRIALNLLAGLRVVVDHETSGAAFSATSELALKYSLSAYDAAYLELARRKSLPLATRDEPLKTAARKAGVALV